MDKRYLVSNRLCPFCGAKPGKWCVTKGGRPTSNHLARVNAPLPPAKQTYNRRTRSWS